MDLASLGIDERLRISDVCLTRQPAWHSVLKRKGALIGKVREEVVG